MFINDADVVKLWHPNDHCPAVVWSGNGNLVPVH